MSLNPSRTVRAILYVLTAVGTPVVAYLNAKGIIGATEVTFWSAEVAVVSGLAALNTTDRTEATVAVTAPADVNVALSNVEVTPMPETSIPWHDEANPGVVPPA